MLLSRGYKEQMRKKGYPSIKISRRFEEAAYRKLNGFQILRKVLKIISNRGVQLKVTI